MDLSKITRLFSRRTGGIRRRLLKWGLTLLGIALIANTLAGSIFTRRLIKNDRAFTEASILDGHGMEMLKISERSVYLPSELVDQSDAAKFKSAIKGENYISPVYTSAKAEPYVTIAVPLKTTPQEVAGVITVEANLKILWEVI